MSRNVSVNSEPQKTVRTYRSASVFSIRTNRVNFEVPVKVPRRLSSSWPRWGPVSGWASLAIRALGREFDLLCET
jgi:hypothetical protein